MATTKPHIRWLAKDDSGQWQPRTSAMRGRWGFDATCTCGWSSRTGGATEASVRRAVGAHLLDAHDITTRNLWR